MTFPDVTLTLLLNSSVVLYVSDNVFFALNNDFVHSIISLLYKAKTVIPATNPVCQLKIDEISCFHTGVAFLFSAIRDLYSFLARCISSASMGKLLPMADMNVFRPYARDGSSRATC